VEKLFAKLNSKLISYEQTGNYVSVSPYCSFTNVERKLANIFLYLKMINPLLYFVCFFQFCFFDLLAENGSKLFAFTIG